MFINATALVLAKNGYVQESLADWGRLGGSTSAVMTADWIEGRSAS